LGIRCIRTRFCCRTNVGGSLPYGFPVIDKFNPETGVATSIKSIDVTADSYTKGNGLFNKLKSYVNKLDDFQGATRGNFSVEGGDLPGEFADIDHLIPAQTDHRFRGKLTT
jgi:hypothetical protein